MYTKIIVYNFRALKAYLEDLSVVSFNYDIICSSETLVSNKSHVS